MKDWEFLIQQAGDRHWHSLDNNRDALATGNYRMVARTPYPNQVLSVKLTYQETTGHSLNIALQESRQTNGEGLVLVFPYRDLSSGNWQVSFTGSGSEDSTSPAADPWENAIAFHVSDRLPLIEEISSNKNEINPQNSIYPVQSSDQSLAEDLGMPPDLALPRTTPLETIAPASFPLAITLARNEFSEMGESFLILAGQVEAIIPDSPFSFPARLRYRLQDLDSAAYLLDEPKSWLPMLGDALPFTFKETLILPPTQATDLLGEILIETEAGKTLAQVLFNLTLSHRSEKDSEEEAINYTIQLSNLENHSSFTFEVIVPKEAAETPLNVDLPNPAKMNRLLKRSLLLERQVLPPKIEPILVKSPPKKSLQLPKISPS